MSVPGFSDSRPVPVKVVRQAAGDHLMEMLKRLPAGVGFLFLTSWIVMLIAGSLGFTQYGYWQVLLGILAVRLVLPSRTPTLVWTWKNGADK